MYNKSAFNRAPFNRELNGDTVLTATVLSIFSVEIAPIKMQVKLPAVAVASEMSMASKQPGMMMPIGAVSIGAESNVVAMLRALMPLSPVRMEAVFSVSAGAVRTAESEEMVLEGLNLRPGQTLIIDTDTLEIEVDNEVRVDCWVTGGTFFQFKAGENSLALTDNAEHRNLLVTVLWADRYL